MGIEDWREEIDAVDQELLRLLNHRASLAAEIGRQKARAGLPLCDPVRETEVLRRVHGANAGPLDGRALAKIFQRIIRESRRVQERAAGDAEQAEEDAPVLTTLQRGRGAR
ncbi:MAG: chorismate mutase [Pyrinomonadaceae bacterium]